MSKTQIVLATGEVYDVEDKGERRILIPVGCIKQEEEKHEQSLHLLSIEEEENRKVSKMLTFLLALLLGKVRNLWKSMCIRERRLY